MLNRKPLKRNTKLNRHKFSTVLLCAALKRVNFRV